MTDTKRFDWEWFGLEEALTAGRSDLARCVGDVDAFLRDHWEKEPLLYDAGDFSDLLSLEKFDRILTQIPIPVASLHVVSESVAVPEEALVHYRGGTGPLADPTKALDHFDRGATLVLHGLHRWWPPLREMCRRLSAVLSHKVVADAYLTPPGQNGHLRHYDTHDVLVLQVAGAKHWRVEKPVVTLPVRSQYNTPERLAPSEVVLDKEIQVGQCLYLPRGHIHTVSCLAEPSLHVTFGIEALTWEDAITLALRAQAHKDVALRRVLPPGFATGETPADFDLPERAALDSYQGLAAAARERFWVEEHRNGGEGRLRSILGAHEVTGDTRVRRPAGLVARLRVDDGGVALRVDDRELRCPMATLDAIRTLLSATATATATKVADLPGLSPAHQVSLVRRLLRAGVLIRS